MSAELTHLIIKKFIARADVKAQQVSADAYMPVVERDESGKPIQGKYVPWERPDVEAHLAGEHTYGHYFLDRDSTCKLFAFDIDLAEGGFLPGTPSPIEVDPAATDADIAAWERSFELSNPREAWRDRKHIARTYLKMELHIVAHLLAAFTSHEMGLPTAVAYSGNKGLHVYGFTGRRDAADVRAGALIAIEALGFEAKKGFWQHPEHLSLNVEVYPKQDRVNSDGLGNLMRLPLGKNLKAPKDPTFFVDMTAPLNTLAPVDPFFALAGSPFKREGE